MLAFLQKICFICLYFNNYLKIIFYYHYLEKNDIYSLLKLIKVVCFVKLNIKFICNGLNNVDCGLALSYFKSKLINEGYFNSEYILSN